MDFFNEATLRLKQQLKTTQDKVVAEFLGFKPSAWVRRKNRDAFPEKELYALAATRPDLEIDVKYVLTGKHTREKNEPSGAYAVSPAEHKQQSISNTLELNEALTARLNVIIEASGGIDAVAKKLDSHKDRVAYNVEHSHKTPAEWYIKFARELKVSLDYVLLGVSASNDESNFYEVPEYNVLVAADHGAWNDEQNIIGTKSFSVDWLKSRNLHDKPLAVIQVMGDSQKDLLWHGDSILVNLAPIDQLMSNKLYVVRINDELVVKFVQRMPSGKLLLSSKNVDYPPFEVDTTTDDVQVVGKLASSSRDWTLYN